MFRVSSFTASEFRELIAISPVPVLRLGSWRLVAEAVNEAAAGQESLYRKSLGESDPFFDCISRCSSSYFVMVEIDCEKTWKDTLRRHFGLQGRRR